MRQTFPLPGRFDIDGLHAHLGALALPGLNGHSQDIGSGMLHFEFPDRDEEGEPLTAGELAQMDALVASYVFKPSWQPVRETRAPLLEAADHAINKAEDQGQDTAALRAYRQALRDVTKQADPENVIWPSPPTM